MSDQHLTHVSLLRLLAVLALVLAPHLTRLPAWEIAAVLALLGWRTLAAMRQWDLPKPMLRAFLTLAAFAAVIGSYGRINGQHAGTALLVIMAALKLLEMRSRRDVMVTVFLMYFILVTHFLFSQEIWTILYLLTSTIAITALLIDVNHVSEPLPIKSLLRIGSTMVAFAMPLMVVIFILFPRVPGPLWGLPSDSGAERSGLPDSMSVEGLSELILSDEVSFRVKFFGKVPPRRERYWRGPVFDRFDGQEWKSSGFRDGPTRNRIEFKGDPIRYEIVLEPQRHRWMFSMDMINPADGLPPKSYISDRHQLLSQGEVRERVLYRATSYPQYHLQFQLGRYERQLETALPGEFNPRARELAANWRKEGLSDLQIVERILKMFREEKFYYTLQPPPVGRNTVDDFLFDTRKGFCQHYASTFTMLMRAAGIPAHVVIGYQGGEMNEFGDYYVVRQSDAHAWSEIWLEDRGWVRIDPTAAVSPDRIERGLAGTPSLAGELPDFLRGRGDFVMNLQARWDWVNNGWNRLVLAYGPELQAEFLKRFGLVDWSDMILALTVLTMTILSVVGLLMMRQFAPAPNRDAALKLWMQAQKKLLRRGIVQRPDEGPRDFVQRMHEEHPAAAAAMNPVLQVYLKLRYLQEPAPELQRQLTQLVRKLRL